MMKVPSAPPAAVCKSLPLIVTSTFSELLWLPVPDVLIEPPAVGITTAVPCAELSASTMPTLNSTKSWSEVKLKMEVSLPATLETIETSGPTIVTTGIAGPGGGSKEKPVGLVYIGLYVSGKVIVKKFIFQGDRKKVRTRATLNALDLLRRELIKL